MTLDSWLHFGHILSAIVGVGGGFVLSLVGSRVRTSADPNAIREFARTLMYVGLRIMMPAVIGTLVFGVWMVLDGSGWSLTQLWVLLALGLFMLAFLIGAIYLSRIGIQLQRMADDSAASMMDGKALLNRWIFGYRMVLIVLVVAVRNMIFKPGL